MSLCEPIAHWWIRAVYGSADSDIPATVKPDVELVIGADLFVARGTPIAMVVTHYMGDPTVVTPPPTHYSTAVKMAHQFLGGLPVYLVLSTVAFFAVRLIVRSRA